MRLKIKVITHNNYYIYIYMSWNIVNQNLNGSLKAYMLKTIILILIDYKIILVTKYYLMYILLYLIQFIKLYIIG